jgi:hypothetical protein
MGMEISVNAVVIEQDDGSYKAICPDLGMETKGKNGDEAVRSLKEMVTNRIREAGGAGNVQLSSVKCLKMKIPVD